MISFFTVGIEENRPIIAIIAYSKYEKGKPHEKGLD